MSSRWTTPSTLLAEVDPRKCQVIELRFFGGFSVEETAQAMGSFGRDHR